MEITVKEFIKQLQDLKPELSDTKIKIIAENGLFLTPVIRLKLKDEVDTFNTSAENVESVVLRWG